MQAIKILAAVFALAAGAVSAQPSGPPLGGRHGGPGGPLDIDRLSVLLDLDAYQQTEVAKILDAQRAAREAARAQLRSSGERPSFEAIDAARKAQAQDTLTKLQGVLTEPQIAKFKVLTERPEHHRGPRPDASSGGQPAAPL